MMYVTGLLCCSHPISVYSAVCNINGNGSEYVKASLCRLLNCFLPLIYLFIPNKDQFLDFYRKQIDHEDVKVEHVTLTRVAFEE